MGSSARNTFSTAQKLIQVETASPRFLPIITLAYSYKIAPVFAVRRQRHCLFGICIYPIVDHSSHTAQFPHKRLLCHAYIFLLSPHAKHNILSIDNKLGVLYGKEFHAFV